MTVLLEVRGLTAFYGSLQVLHGLDFHLEAGGVLLELEKASHQDLAPAVRFWNHLLRSEMLLAFGKTVAAQKEIERVSRLAPEYRSRTVELLARARVKLGSNDHSGAIRLYR